MISFKNGQKKKKYLLKLLQLQFRNLKKKKRMALNKKVTLINSQRLKLFNRNNNMKLKKETKKVKSKLNSAQDLLHWLLKIRRNSMTLSKTL